MTIRFQLLGQLQRVKIMTLENGFWLSCRDALREQLEKSGFWDLSMQLYRYFLMLRT